MSIFTFILFIAVLIISFTYMGIGLKSMLKIKSSLNPTLLGLSTWYGFFFLISFFLVQKGFPFILLVLLTCLFSLTLIIYGAIKNDRVVIDKKWAWILLFVIFFSYLSSLSPLGETMGDNVFYFQEVSLNIDINVLNSFIHSNGIIYDTISNGNDIYFTFYLFFSVIIFLYTKLLELLNLSVLPTYVYTTWLANILFYTVSGLLIKNILDYFVVKSRMLIIGLLLFMGFYVGTFYYHLALPHIGNTFINSVLAFLILVIYDYLKNGNKSNIILMSLISYGIVSMGNVGVIIVFYIGFGLIALSLFRKDENAFLLLPAFSIPVIHYLFLLRTVDGSAQLPIIDNIALMYPTLLLILLIGFSLYKLRFLHKWMFRFGKITIILIWFGIMYLSYTTTENYWVRFMQFFDVKANFDRVQDFFSFNTLSNSIINLVHYVLLGAMVYYKKTRSLGLVFVIILVFFMNPFIYPLLYDKILWLFNRAYFSVLNVGSLGIGLYALYQLLEEKIKLRMIVFSVIGVISIVYGIQNLQVSFKGNYQNGFEMNPIYKLPQHQVDVLEELRQIIKIEDLDTPRVVSQIYGTLMYLERIDIIGFTVDQRRSLYYTNEYSELLQIFYTPVFPGDDGLRLEAPVEKTCQLLMENQVDFVIYDKELSVFDSNAGNWIPTYWYIRDCYEKRYENDRYILYRYFW